MSRIETVEALDALLAQVGELTEPAVIRVGFRIYILTEDENGECWGWSWHEEGEPKNLPTHARALPLPWVVLHDPSAPVDTPAPRRTMTGADVHGLATVLSRLAEEAAFCAADESELLARVTEARAWAADYLSDSQPAHADTPASGHPPCDRCGHWSDCGTHDSANPGGCDCTPASGGGVDEAAVLLAAADYLREHPLTISATWTGRAEQWLRERAQAASSVTPGLIVTRAVLHSAAEALYASRWFDGELAAQDDDTISIYVEEAQVVASALGVTVAAEEG